MNSILDLATPVLAFAGEAHEAAEKAGAEEPNTATTIFYLVLTLAAIFFVASIARKGFTRRVFKGKAAQWSEQLYLFLENMCVGTIGSHGRKYIPIIATFWLVIFFSNVLSLFFPTAPTANLSFNLGMALIAVGYVQWEGIKANGLGGHFSHFAGPKLAIYMLPVTGLIFVIEIISEVMKNLSLSLRLFGNIHGGHEAAAAMNALGGGWVPFGAFLLPIKLLTCVVQAMIFCLLMCVYLSLVTSHHEEAEGNDPDGHRGTLADAYGHDELAHGFTPQPVGAGVAAH